MSSIFFNDMVKAYLDDGIELLRELSFDGPGFVTVEQIKEELLPKYSQDWRATVVTLDALAEGVKRELKTRFGHPGLNPHSDGFDFQL